MLGSDLLCLSVAELRRESGGVVKKPFSLGLAVVSSVF